MCKIQYQKEILRPLGIKPGSSAWEEGMLTVIETTLIYIPWKYLYIFFSMKLKLINEI